MWRRRRLRLVLVQLQLLSIGLLLLQPVLLQKRAHLLYGNPSRHRQLRQAILVYRVDRPSRGQRHHRRRRR